MVLRARNCIKKLSATKPGDPAEEAKIKLGTDDVMNLSSNENPLGPSRQAVKAMQEAITSVHLYPDGNSTDLKNALSRHLGVDKENLLFGNGSDELIKLIAETFIEPGDNVNVCDPSLLEYHFAAYLMSGELVKIPLDEMACNLEKILHSITDDTKLIYISNPYNLTGTIYTQKDLERFIKRVPSDVVVVCDEAYIDYCNDEECGSGITLIDKYPNLVVLRTFSKLYALAGLRLGFAIANKEMISMLQRVREPFNVNRIAQAGAIASLKDRKHIEKTKKCTWRGLKFYYRNLPEIDLGYVKSQANFILIDLKSRNDEIITENLFRKGILVKSGTSIGLKGYIRVTIGLMHQNYAVISALKEVIQNQVSIRRSI
ncbi:histidinol-phosphate transaminase [Natranaerofaba carboxydovora]|uniref:histidinol-phosphate transaminase n=1 Tax=Natranaerofaba carboxydovora TaxID=2742683 RepID=UPI001F12A0C9|nr:histidinol-phosphate transaminase [Natranaerofaba carboxydovora]UMZ74840.1 Histidinol-phosphate aminotransferase [Natranaerofaba carboxydovora]